MILNNKKTTVETSGMLDHQVATVSMNPVVMHILSRDLYQKHVESPFREVLVNALDAHTEASQDKPVEIHLPSMWDNIFYVRDFGKGLSHEDFMRIYLDYGNSTRRETNEVCGGFGLGTKSPLAYTSSFSVSSYNGGERRDYLVYYNEDNIPCVDLVCKEPSDETGLKVQFTTLKSNDYTQFKKAAENLLPWIPKEKYICNLELDITPPQGQTYGTLSLLPGSGLSVTMGFVNYKLELQTVLEYLQSKAINLDVKGTDYLAFNILNTLTRSHMLCISAPIGSYPVHPSREHINVTPKCISLLIQDLQNALNILFQDDALDLSGDIFKWKILGFLPEVKDKLSVRARYLTRSSWSSTCRIDNQINTYGGLVATLARHGKDFQYAELSQFDLTDYLGKRSVYIFPDFITKDFLVLENEKGTDPLVLELFKGRTKEDLSNHIESFRREREEEVKQEQVTSYPRYKRHTVRSMQDPKHNILMLKSGFPGTKKYHWESAQHNIDTLKELDRKIYWVPTRMGVVQDSNNVDIIDRLIRFSSLLRTKFPLIIGLPASKGTKKIEATFENIAQLKTELDNFENSSYIQRRANIYSLAYLIRSSLKVDNLHIFKAYGTVDWLNRILEMSTKYNIQSIPVNYMQPVKNLKANEQLIKEKIEELGIIFPDIFTWYSLGKDTKKLSAWAEQVAEFTDCKPTGAKYKNVT